MARIDAAAVKILDKSVAAYETRDNLAFNFSLIHSRDGKAQPELDGQGTLILGGSDKVRLEWQIGDVKAISVANGSLMSAQTEPTSYYETRDDEEDFVYTLVSLLNEPLGYLMTDDNTLATESGFGWKSVEVVPDKNFDCVELRQNFAPVTYRIYFDRLTHLVSRIETEREQGHPFAVEPIIDLAILKLTSANVAITPATFQYTPPAGAKLLIQTDTETPKSYDERLVVGAKPFAFASQSLSGKTVSLDDYQGKVVLLDFWATWCEPCIFELPVIEANYHKYRARGFDVVAISADSDEAALRAFVEKHDLPWPQIASTDWRKGASKPYGVLSFPTSFLIGKDGKIAAINPRGEELEPAIIKALAQ